MSTVAATTRSGGGTAEFRQNFAGASEEAVASITSVKAEAVGTVIDASGTDGEWLVDEVQLNNLVSSQGAG